MFPELVFQASSKTILQDSAPSKSQISSDSLTYQPEQSFAPRHQQSLSQTGINPSAISNFTPTEIF